MMPGQGQTVAEAESAIPQPERQATGTRQLNRFQKKGADHPQARAARWLGISRVTLREKLRFHGLTEPAEPSDSATR